MSKKNAFGEYRVIRQGAPIINSGNIIRKSKNIVLLEIDLKSKYCEVDCLFKDDEGNFGIHIGTTKHSIHLNTGVKKDEPTVIEFSNSNGWGIYLANISRYTLRICLIRELP